MLKLKLKVKKSDLDSRFRGNDNSGGNDTSGGNGKERRNDARLILAAMIGIYFVSLFGFFNKAFALDLDKTRALFISGDYKAAITEGEKTMAKASEDAMQFGCDPDWNAYGDRDIPQPRPPVDPAIYPYRHAGGHIHVGDVYYKKKSSTSYFTDETYDKVELIKLLDLLVGVPSVLIDRDPGNIMRRRIYGRAGSYRIQSHGVEYRSLSNFWLTSPALYSLVSGLSRAALDYWMSGLTKDVLSIVPARYVRKAIDKNDATLARSICECLKSSGITHLGDTYSLISWEWIFRFVDAGGMKLMSTLEDEWKLDGGGVDFQNHGRTAQGWATWCIRNLLDNNELRKYYNKGKEELIKDKFWSY